MYVVHWTDGESTHDVATAHPLTAWKVYRMICAAGEARFVSVTKGGMYLNPLKGAHLPACKDGDECVLQVNRNYTP